MKKRQSGQSTIEFLFCFVFAVSFILMVFNVSINYVSGYVAHYATFMASRVFLTHSSNFNTMGPGDTISKATDRARATFNIYSLDFLGINSSGFNVSNAAKQELLSADEYLMVGVYTKFEKKIDIIGQITGQKKLELISESYLGREPSRGVCVQRTCFGMFGGNCPDSTPVDYTVYDDILNSWMNKAKQQAIDLAKQTIEDLKGMTSVGAKAVVKEAGNQFIYQIIVGLLFLIIFMITKSCNN
jgi:flavin-binding protein dodecin